MRIHHIAVWTFRLEEMKDFYVRYFKGKSNNNTSIQRKDLNPTLSASMTEPTWN